jgi:hypothetical protein
MYSSRGEWLRTTELPTSDTPISLALDSFSRVHILYKKYVNVYDVVSDSMVMSYNLSDSDITPLKIRSNYVKEIFYIVYNNKIVKYFKNGVKFTDLNLAYPKCIDNITNIHQDKNRNLYILTKDYIVKYTDLMFLDSKLYTDSLLNINSFMWDLEDIFIDKDELVQDVTYNRAFHRLWDNIETLRNVIRNKNKTDLTPLYSKEQIFVGQNEIVTAGVMNRCLKYLWDNLSTLNKYLSN